MSSIFIPSLNRPNSYLITRIMSLGPSPPMIITPGSPTLPESSSQSEAQHVGPGNPDPRSSPETSRTVASEGRLKPPLAKPKIARHLSTSSITDRIRSRSASIAADLPGPPKKTPTADLKAQGNDGGKIQPKTYTLHRPVGTDKSPLLELDVVVVHMFVGPADGSNDANFDDLATFSYPETKSAVDRDQLQKQGHVDKPTLKDGLTKSGKITLKRNWLKDEDMLHRFIPEARIMTIGFNLRTSNQNTPLDFLSYAESLLRYLSEERKTCPSRPLLFIGHGYGGIIIEKAICRASQTGLPDQQIVKSTTGVLFFATPLQGSDALVKHTSAELGLQSGSSKFVDLGAKSQQLPALFTTFSAIALESGFFYFNYIERPAAPPGSAPADASERPSLVKILIESRENPQKIVNLPLHNPLESVVRFQSTTDRDFQAVSELIVRLAQVQQLINAASDPKGLPVIESLIAKGIKVNLQNRLGMAALHVAVNKSNFELVRLLLGKGRADVGLRNREGETPLHLAVKQGDSTVITLLLRNGADVNAQDNSKKTPLKLAKKKKYRGPDDSIKNLLQHKPPVEGPSVKVDKGDIVLTRKPPDPYGIKACKKTLTMVTELFLQNRTEKHLSALGSVYEMIYDMDHPPEHMLDAVRPDDFEEVPVCRWFHIPENNMAWVEDLFVRLKVNGSVWGHQYGRSHGKVPHSRSIVPSCVHVATHDKDQELLAIFMPYISYEMNTRQNEFADLVENESVGLRVGLFWEQLMNYMRTDSHPLEAKTEDTESAVHRSEIDQSEDHSDHGGSDVTSAGVSRRSGSQKRSIHKSNGDTDSLRSASPSPQQDPEDSDDESDSTSTASIPSDLQTEKMDFAESALIRAYVNHDPPLHIRRTLDQSYYYMLESTKVRDKDQVSTRWARNPLFNRKNRPHNILMVDQCWLWVVREKVDPKVGETETQAPAKLYETGAQTENSTDGGAQHNLQDVPKKDLRPKLDKEGDCEKKANRTPDIVVSSFPRRKGVASSGEDDLHWNVLNHKPKERKAICTTMDLISQITATLLQCL